jgi:hypothetical protein
MYNITVAKGIRPSVKIDIYYYLKKLRNIHAMPSKMKIAREAAIILVFVSNFIFS